MEKDEIKFNELTRADRYLIDDLSRESFFAGVSWQRPPPRPTLDEEYKRVKSLKRNLAERIEFLRIHIAALETKIIVLEMENKLNEKTKN